MLRHVGDELLLGLLARQAELSKSGITLTQDVLGLDPKGSEQGRNFRGAQGFLGVFPVAIFDLVFLEQGDRLATCASGGFANQLEHEAQLQGDRR